MTDTVVISGAAPVGADAAASTPLLSVPDVAELGIVDPGQGAQLIVHNATAAPLSVAVDDSGDLSLGPGEGAAIPLRSTDDGDRLHVQILSAAPLRAVTAIVTIEASEEGRIAVGQAIAKGTP